MTQVLELIDTELDRKTDDNKNKEWAHYAEAASVTEGYIMGTPVYALCGIIFIPSKNPEKLRICPACKEIMEALFFSTE